jgi:hypothetical protein
LKKLILTDILCVLAYLGILYLIFVIPEFNSNSFLNDPNSLNVLLLSIFLIPVVIGVAVTKDLTRGLLMSLRMYQLILLLPAMAVAALAANGAAGIIPFLVILAGGSMVFFYTFLLKFTLGQKKSYALIVITVCAFITVLMLYFILSVVTGFFGLHITGSTLPKLTE